MKGLVLSGIVLLMLQSAASVLRVEPDADWVGVVAGAEAGDTVFFSRGLFLGGCQIGFKHDLRLVGEGLGLTTWSCQYSGSRNFNVTGGAQLHIEDMTITGGDEYNGGCGLVRGGGLSVERVVFEDCRAASEGGAVFAEEGQLSVRNSTFRSNVADSGGGAIVAKASGGSFIDSSFEGCSARNSGGAVVLLFNSFGLFDHSIIDHCEVWGDDSQGGAVLAVDSSLVVRNGSSFTSNEAEDGGGAVLLERSFMAGSEGVLFYDNWSDKDGGVVYAIGGSHMEFHSGVEFIYNYADYDGGALSMEEDQILNIFDNVTFIDNWADHYGGGIWADEGCEIDISQNVRFFDNTGWEDAGGIYLDDGGRKAHLQLHDDVVFMGNEGEDGGAVFLDDARLTVYRMVQFIGNVVRDAGGAIYMRDGSVLDASDNVLFRDNAANGGSGGAIRMNEDTTATIRYTWFEGNKADHDGGAIAVVDDSHLLVENSTFVENNCGDEGGVLYFTSCCTITIQNQVLFERNNAENSGGAIVSESSCNEVVIRNGVEFIENNALSREGGAIWCGGDKCDLTITGPVRFRENTAQTNGGAISVTSGRIEASQIVLDSNRCAVNGGGITVEGAEAYLTDLVVANGFAKGEGGGVHLDASAVIVKNITVQGNFANEDGGGVNCEDNSNVLIEDSTFLDNTANSGGAIAATLYTTITLSSCFLDMNSAFLQGGGIGVFASSQLILHNGVQIQRGDANEGGAVFLNLDSSIVMSRGVIFRANHAFAAGGGIATTGASAAALQENATISDCTSPMGAGVYAKSSLLLARDGVFLQGNTALDDIGAGLGGGGLYLAQSEVQLIGLVEITHNLAFNGPGGGVHIKQGSFTAQGPGLIFSECYAVTGGALAVIDSNMVHLSGAKFISNSGGESGTFRLMSEDAESSVEMNNIIFTKSVAEGSGGVGSIMAGAALKMINSTISDSSAGGRGGGLYVEGAMSLVATNFCNCSAVDDGGSLYAKHASVFLDRTTVLDSHSLGSGGAWAASTDSSLVINTSHVSLCSAGDEGGALSISSGARVELHGDVNFVSNHAPQGGAISNQGSASTMHFHARSLTLEQNFASVGGGGAVLSTGPIFSSGARHLVPSLQHNHCALKQFSTLFVFSFLERAVTGAKVVVARNKATKSGGGMLFSGPGSLLKASTMSSLTVQDNEAMDGGGLAITENAQLQIEKEACELPCLAEMKGNSICDVECFSKPCGWDGGDCRSLFEGALFEGSNHSEIMDSACDMTRCSLAEGAGNLTCSATCLTPSCSWGQMLPSCDPVVDAMRRCPVFRLSAYRAGLYPLPPGGALQHHSDFQALAAMSLKEMLDEYPDCGDLPIVLCGNKADRHGGGLYKSGCALTDSCFIGSMPQHDWGSTAVWFASNTAMTAGGGVFVGCSNLGSCSELSEQSVALPMKGNPSLSQVLNFGESNKAMEYGNNFASKPASLEVKPVTHGLVPGQSFIDLDFRILDAAGNAVKRSGVVTVDVCPPGSSACDLNPIQSRLYFQATGTGAWSSTKSYEYILESCIQGLPSIRLLVAVVGADELSLSTEVEVQCQQCVAGQEKQSLAPANMNGTMLWSCVKCPLFEYVIDPNMGCQECPKFADCNSQKTPSLTARLTGSQWWASPETGEYHLQSCPSGFYVHNKSDAGIFSAVSQECKPCEGHSECTADHCTTCSACKDGYYKKEEKSSFPCSPCEKNTYGLPGDLGKCHRCPDHSTTEGTVGQVGIKSCHCDPAYFKVFDGDSAVCRTCPTGALCPDKSCAFNPAASCVLEDFIEHWQFHEDGDPKLSDCPPGHLLINSPADMQRCQKCEPTTYALSGTDGCQGTGPEARCLERSCTPCPLGAICEGGQHFNATAMSRWEVSEADGFHAYRVVECGPGTILVRRDDRVAFDQCVVCPAKTYTIESAVYPHVLSTDRAENAGLLCLACPIGASCPGGAEVTAKKGWWKLPHTLTGIQSRRSETAGADTRNVTSQVQLYKCQKGACLEGGACAEGRNGTLCGQCLADWAMKAYRCVRCGTISAFQWRTTTAVVLGLLFLFVWGLLWSPYLSSTTDTDADSLADCLSACFAPIWFRTAALWIRDAMHRLAKWLILNDYISLTKVMIAFWQVMSSMDRAYVGIQWPETMATIWQFGDLLRVDLLDIPGLACATKSLSYLGKLRLYTILPLVVAFAFAIPSICGAITHGISSAKFKQTLSKAFFWIFFWAFLLYPATSTVVIEGFNCRKVGDENLLLVEITEPCPRDQPDSSSFIWVVVGVVLYPVGIPTLMLAVLLVFRVPQLARMKRKEAILSEMIRKYLEQSKERFVCRLVQSFGKHPTNALIQDRARYMFHGAAGGNKGHMDFESVLQWCCDHKISGRNVEEFEMLFRSFGEEEGILTFEEFLDLMISIIDVEGQVTGEEKIEDIGEIPLQLLCRYRWSALVREEEGADVAENAILQSLARTQSATSSVNDFSEHSNQALMRRASSLGSPSRLGSLGPATRLSSAGTTRTASSDSNPQRVVDVEQLNQEIQKAHDDEFLCDLTEDAPRSEKLGWLLQAGERLVEKKTITLPTLKWTGDTPEEQNAMDSVGFLFTAYEVEWWFTELIEMARKFFLTGLVVVIYSGEPYQAVAGLLATLISLTFFAKASPFASALINNLQLLSLTTQALTLLYGITLEIQELEEEVFQQSIGLEGLVILLHVLVLVLPICAICYESRHRLRLWAERLFKCARNSKKSFSSRGKQRTGSQGNEAAVLESVAEDESETAPLSPARRIQRRPPTLLSGLGGSQRGLSATQPLSPQASHLINGLSAAQPLSPQASHLINRRELSTDLLLSPSTTQPLSPVTPEDSQALSPSGSQHLSTSDGTSDPQLLNPSVAQPLSPIAAPSDLPLSPSTAQLVSYPKLSPRLTLSPSTPQPLSTLLG